MTPIEVGAIARPHGVRGELKVQLYWSESEALSNAESVLLELHGEQASYDVQGVRAVNKGVLLKLSGVESREAAEALRGAKILIERSLIAVEADEYFLVDLVGCTVWGPDGERVGVVEEIRTHPTVDAAVIRSDHGALLEQIISEAWISEVDLEHKRVSLASLDGLIE